MMRVQRVVLLALAVIIAAGLLAVPVSAAPQAGVGAENPAAFLSGGPDQFSHGPYCPNTNIGVRPALIKAVAKRVKATEDQVLTWICGGKGLQTIVLAYQISKRAGVSMDQVFAMRGQGMSWDSIIGFYDLRDVPGFRRFRFENRPSNNPFRNNFSGPRWMWNQARGVWVLR